jgi:hypothetical protein
MKSGLGITNRVGTAYLLMSIIAPSSVMAQKPEAAQNSRLPETGSVIGHVECGEAKFPGRLAEIRLVPKPADSNSISADPAEASNPPKPHVQIILGHAGLDGSFRMDDVPAGDYLAIARMPGYVAPGTSANMFATDDQLKRLIMSVPVVHIREGQVTSVDLTLKRGAAISGRVQFADGSPMVGASVGWELAEVNLAIESIRMTKFSLLQQTMLSLESYNDQRKEVVTDEEGHYRIFGLSPGNYIVSTVLASQIHPAAQVILSDGTSPDAGRQVWPYPEMTIVYGPGVFRRDDAKIIEIHGSEQVANADIKVDPSGLHAVRGRVLAGDDRHVMSQAMVRIKEDGGHDVGKFTVTEEGGSFKIDYLLPGCYMLEVAGNDRESAAGPNDVPPVERQYQMAKVPVVIGSHDEVVGDILLRVLKPGEKMEFPH